MHHSQRLWATASAAWRSIIVATARHCRPVTGRPAKASTGGGLGGTPPRGRGGGGGAGGPRRTRLFSSSQAAFENSRRKPPLSDMTADALQGYVEHGLRPAREGGVELCCTPELEAAIFVLGPHNGVWDLLPDVDVPVLVVSGAFEPDQPSASAAQIAERLPRGDLVVLPDQGHLGPFSHPTEVADVVSA